MKTINAHADIFGNTGYAIHARKFFTALNRLVPVCLVPKYGALPELFQDDPLLEMLDRILEIDLHAVAISLDCPDQMFRFGGSKRIGYTVFEMDILRSPAVHQLKQLDQVWVPTRWAAGILENNKIPKELVRVVPEGIDPEVFMPELAPYPELATLDGYRFLSVGKWETRKGFHELLRAFDQAFTPQDNVFLVIYSLNEVQALKHVDVKKEVKELDLKLRDKVIFLDSKLPSESHMARLYNSCHAYVSSSKAEGWGLPMMEAMACGLPVIAPNYSGPTEYLTQENSYPFAVTESEDIYCPIFFPERGAFGRWAKINEEALSHQMRHLFEHPEEAILKGRHASQEVRSRWTWDAAAKIAWNHLKA